MANVSICTVSKISEVCGDGYCKLMNLDFLLSEEESTKWMDR